MNQKTREMVIALAVHLNRVYPVCHSRQGGEFLLWGDGGIQYLGKKYFVSCTNVDSEPEFIIEELV